MDVPSTTTQRAKEYVRLEDVMPPDFEMAHARFEEGNTRVEVINPLAVVNDLHKDRFGVTVQRLRALFYREDEKSRKYPMLFEVDILPYGYCIETSNTKHYSGTEHDQCSPFHLREVYTIERTNRTRNQKGKTLQLAATKCFKHRLQVPVMVKNNDQ